MTGFFLAQVVPTVTAPVIVGPATQIILKLIEQLPAILGALGLLTTAIVGLLNYRRLGEVKEQNNGHMTTMLARQEMMSTQLANSVPTAALTAVANASAATAAAAASTHASDRAADRATDRAADRAFDRASPLDRRSGAAPIKVDIVSVPDVPIVAQQPPVVVEVLKSIDANTAAVAENTAKDKDA